MPLAPQTRLGTYEILGPLGAGGMGEVYRARDLRLGREVAIKVLPADVASSPDRLARFEREARTVAGLNHPNIVTLHSVEDAEGIRFLTMELVDGQTLSALLTPGGLPLPRVLEIAIPLTDALVAAHERGVIHRDLKPGNVMVTREGRVKVLDFGLAKMIGAGAPPPPGATLGDTTGSPISREDDVVGTVPYTAPEQLRGEAADARSDLFSLGIILYELATGHRPFTGGSSAEVTSAILRDTPKPLGRLRADLSGDLERLIDHCLEKNPRERVQTALDVNNALRRLRRVLERGEPGMPAPEKIASLAVLPFVNRSASPDDEYFSDGLADELLNLLAKIKGLRVTARTSSFLFKGTKDDVPTIGRRLNVATLLEGSVRKTGNRVRISVQLINVADGSHLWSETYDRTLEDIFAVQDDIAQSVVKELRVTLLGEEEDSDARRQVKADVVSAGRGRGTDPEAHRLYLLARHLIDRWTRQETTSAIGYLKEALERDPAFALAWSELGRAYAREADRGWVPVAEGYGRAREAVERSLVLDPDLADAHGQMGWIRMGYDWDWRGAETSFARGLDLAPGNALVIRGAAVLAVNVGRVEEAIGLFHRAVEQDPLSATTYGNLGVALQSADRFTEAEEAYRKALELAPRRSGTLAYLSLCLLAQGRSRDALAEATREPEESLRLWSLAIVHGAMGHAAESDASLRDLIEKYGEGSAYQVAEAYGARSEMDAAFEWLDRAYALRDTGLTEIKTSLNLRSLHGDPRWGVFLRKMGLED